MSSVHYSLDGVTLEFVANAFLQMHQLILEEILKRAARALHILFAAHEAPLEVSNRLLPLHTTERAAARR